MSDLRTRCESCRAQGSNRALGLFWLRRKSQRKQEYNLPDPAKRPKRFRYATSKPWVRPWVFPEHIARVKLGSATKIHGRLGQRAQEAKDPVARLRRGPCYRGCADRSFYPAWASLLTIFVCRNFPYSFRATFPTSRVPFTRICFRSRFEPLQ